ncbi:hypothetical protein F4703DRAFT_1258080 [Phycomyces blakesleeanus]
MRSVQFCTFSLSLFLSFSLYSFFFCSPFFFVFFLFFCLYSFTLLALALSLLGSSFLYLSLFPSLSLFRVSYRTTITSYHPRMDTRLMNSRSRGLRESTAYFHLAFMFAGLSVMAMGAYTINSSTSITVSLSLLLIGGIITVISFIGCFGAHLEHTGFLRTYSSATTIFLIIQIALVGIIYCHRSQIDYYASSLWDFFNDNDIRFLVDFEQA